MPRKEVIQRQAGLSLAINPSLSRLSPSLGIGSDLVGLLREGSKRKSFLVVRQIVAMDSDNRMYL